MLIVSIPGGSEEKAWTCDYEGKAQGVWSSWYVWGTGNPNLGRFLGCFDS